MRALLGTVSHFCQVVVLESTTLRVLRDLRLTVWVVKIKGEGWGSTWLLANVSDHPAAARFCSAERCGLGFGVGF